MLVWFQGSSVQPAVSLRTAPRAGQPLSPRRPPDRSDAFCTDPPFKGLTDVNNSVAAFMLIRGPHAFLGWSWVSCSGDCFTELKDCPPPPGNQIHYDITLGGLVGPDCKHAAVLHTASLLSSGSGVAQMGSRQSFAMRRLRARRCLCASGAKRRWRSTAKAGRRASK